MVSHNYWLKRASLQDSLMRATEDETIKRINNQLAILEDDLVKEIHTFYSRYAQDNRMTQADAMKYLTDDELKEFQNVNLARFREMALDPKTDPALLDALSYRHRISRKQAMIHEIQRKTREVYSSSGAISATVGQGLASGYIKTAAQVGKDMAQAGILSIKPVIKLNDDLILRRMSSKWSGTEFSSRVWTQGQEHFNSIRETLDKAFTGGWGLDKTVLELRKRTGVAKHNVERLVRTEMTAYNTMANYDMYKALGAKTYKIEAILDSKTSAICRHQNNKVYLMDDFAPGTTAPPFHVHCRSKIIPTTSEEESKFLESHGYGSPDDSSSDVDHDGQSTSGLKPTLDEVLQMYLDKANELSIKYTGKHNNDKAFFNSISDPAADYYGPAKDYNPERLKKIQDELKSMGIAYNVVSDREVYGYSPGLMPGQPGTLVISKWASLSAWEHELLHGIDDFEAGFSGMRIFGDLNEVWRREKRAYDLEIKIAKRLQNQELVDKLKLNKTKEWNRIFREKG